ncbi:right-handed parallel beta-helix repeat-containing protein [Halorarius litoreus]|uniref:right-handed parallel beta-helix repeat-containing protein n=1 Tax=Halorarius litoreus TaxID=2962676 RepID=UPI0020CCC580|nr:NosD domain-containing protein [Halorarius litoreus]
MSRQYSILVPVLVGVLVMSPLTAAGVGLLPGSFDDASQAMTASNATGVTSCRTIDEPGRYELTTDITNGSTDACIRITADDVVFDGNGHVIDGVNATEGSGITTPLVSRLRSNVTVANVTVTNWQFGVEYKAFESGRIENVTVTDSKWSISLSKASITVANSTVSNSSWAGIQVTGSAYGTDYHTRLVGNELTNNRQGVRLLMDDESSVVVEGNTLRANDDGLWVNNADNLTVSGNAFTANTDGIHVYSTNQKWADDCQDPPLAQAAVHRNAFVDNREYAVNNDADMTLNATWNYWGTSDGPSSAADADAPFVDPVTDEPADGSGGAVSEGPHDGVSNVHFDDALGENPLTSA